MATTQREPVAVLSNDEIEILIEELERRWKKYRYAKNRMEAAREEANEAIVALYPHVSGSLIARITGLDRTRPYQIYTEWRNA